MKFPTLTPKQIKEAERKYAERKAQELADLEARSKNLHELVITERFTVKMLSLNRTLRLCRHIQKR